MLGYVDLCVFLELSLTTFMSTSYCNCSVNFKHHHQRGTVALCLKWSIWYNQCRSPRLELMLKQINFVIPLFCWSLLWQKPHRAVFFLCIWATESFNCCMPCLTISTPSYKCRKTAGFCCFTVYKLWNLRADRLTLFCSLLPFSGTWSILPRSIWKRTTSGTGCGW